MSIKKAFVISFIIGLLIPLFARAQIRITEIMYDPVGSDAKREWIEVFNSGTASVDLATYFLFENNVYHKLTAQGGRVLEAGAYAIIVDSIPEVLADYPGYAGLIFDSAFSLGNTGETISIANAQKEAADTFAYTSDMGASSDGNSLQINGTQVVTAGPTFAAANKTESEVPEGAAGTTTDSGTGSGSSSGSGTSSHSQQESVTAYVPTPAFKLGAGRNRTVLINTPIDFEAQISKPEAKPSLRWNLGDMETARGRKITHTYEYPGTYQVVLEARTPEQYVISRTEVLVLAPEIKVEQSTSTISITNLLSKEINLGTFRLMFITGSRPVPENTLIQGGDTITFARRPEEILESLEYPNGMPLLQFDVRTDLLHVLSEYCRQETLPVVCKGKNLERFLIQ
jgi:hypothetical protein